MVKRRSYWPVVALVLLAFALRVFRLDCQELHGDEAFAVVLSAQPARVIVSEALHSLDPHPPLEYLFLRAWMALAGWSEFAARFPSVVAGTVAVVLAYALGRRMLGQAAGMWGAVFVALNPFQVWYAQEARTYAASVALALATTLALWVALGRDERRAWVAYTLLTALHLYLHYYAFFVVLAQGVWALVLWRRHRERLVHFVAAGVGVLLLYLPWLVPAWRVALAYHDGGDSPTLPGTLLHCWRAFSLGGTIQPTKAVPFLLAFGLLAAAGAWWTVRARRRAGLLLGLWLVVPVAGGWLVSLRWPVFDVRYLIAASPAFYLFLGAGASWLADRRLRGQVVLVLLSAICLVGSMISLWNYHFVPEYSRTAGWRQVAAYLDTHAGPNDVLIQNYPDPALTYYHRGPIPHRLLPTGGDVPPQETARILEGIAFQYDRFWFLPYPSPDWDAAGVVAQWLERQADRAEDVHLGKIHLQAYLPLRVAMAQMSPVEARLGEAIRLRGYRLVGMPQPGGTLALTLYWEALAPVDEDYTVFTHLVGAGEAMLGQMDRPPQEAAAPTSTWVQGEVLADHYPIPISPDAPVGSAWLMVGMYDPRSGDRLPVTGQADRSNRVPLVELQISPVP